MGNKNTKKKAAPKGKELKKDSPKNDKQATVNDPQYNDEQPDELPRQDSQTQKSNGVSKPATEKAEIVVALYSHCARATTEMSHEKGDRFRVLDKPNGDWWWVRNLETQLEGFVYSNYVVPATSLEIQEWYFGEFSRKDAEKALLKDPTLPAGTFLVRLAESSSAHKYSLSVRVNSGGQAMVKHHRVFYSNDEFFVHKNRTFATLHDLISHYSNREFGVQILLTQVCPKPPPPQWDLSPHTRDEWEIDRAALTCDKKLGSGNFGDVWHGLWNATREVAIKTLKEGTMNTDAFLQEAAIMKKLRHKNILILYAVCTLEEPILIVTEYMNKGALLDVLRKDGMRLNLADLVDICAQVASGMRYLEDMGLIHRDLAARNVLVDTNKQCKVADFGLARVVENGEYSPNNCKNFPVKWTAPEAICYGQYSIKSDVWSFGILMMEVFTLGATPYPGMTNPEVVEMVPTGYRMSRPRAPIDCPEGLFDCVQKCWSRDPQNRPSFEYLETYLFEWDLDTDINYEEPELQDTN